MRVLAGPDTGLEIDLPPVGAVLGADPGCDVVLADPSVSARHCMIAPAAHGFTVTDLGSKNGTLLDGARVGKVTAPAGAVLALGHTLVELLPADDVIDIPPTEADRFGSL